MKQCVWWLLYHWLHAFLYNDTRMAISKTTRSTYLVSYSFSFHLWDPSVRKRKWQAQMLITMTARQLLWMDVCHVLCVFVWLFLSSYRTKPLYSIKLRYSGKLNSKLKKPRLYSHFGNTSPEKDELSISLSKAKEIGKTVLVKKVTSRWNDFII